MSLLLLLQSTAAPSGVTAQPTAASLTLSTGTPSVVAVGTATRQPTAAALTLSAGTPTVTVPPLCVWTTPGDGVGMSATPVLAFTMPVLGAVMHFQMELDTANTFNTGNLRVTDTSVDEAYWSFWDGAEWQDVPGEGVPAMYGGNAARYTVTSALSAATWYRRVRAGVV